MALTDKFVQDIIACNESYNAGSTLYVFGMEGECSEEPPLYEATLDTAITIGDESADLSITDRVVDGVSTTAVAALVRKGQILTFQTGSVIVAADTLVDITTTAVPIEAAEAAIALSETSNFWSGYELCNITDLPINIDSNTTNRTVLKNGLQGSDVKTRINLVSAVQMIGSPEDPGQQAVVLKASQGTQDIYVVGVKSSGYVPFGRAKVMNWSATGNIEELERISFNVQWQAPFALAYGTTNTAITTADQLIDLNQVLEYAGVEQYS